MTVISASYKTDIPAFYGPWFNERLQEGFVETRNPYNNQIARVSLTPESVEAFVFWTRNAAPFLPILSRQVVDKFPFYIQFTVTGYPRLLETSVISANDAICQSRELSKTYGKSAVVWRYDPVFVSDITPLEFHLDNFSGLAKRLAGAVDEVVVSFTQPYAKTKRNIAHLSKKQEIHFCDPEKFVKQDLLISFHEIAVRNGIRLTICAQPDLEMEIVPGAACIDPERLTARGADLIPAKMQGNRPGCLCLVSRDIGSYDTCPHGCVYCYAVSNPAKAKAAFKSHDRGLLHLG
jgi:hypothetical protein